MRESTTGVLLVGEKGSGKTMLAKELAMMLQHIDIPTIMLTNLKNFDFEKLKKLLQDIEHPACFIFDEFEKSLRKYDGEQQKLLTLLDGCFSGPKRLVIFTANDHSGIDSYFFNRPGRIFYRKDYHGLTVSFVEEYCKDNLNNWEEKLPSLKNLVLQFENFNFDMLQSVVEEMNRYDEDVKTAIQYMNVNPVEHEFLKYKIEIKKDGKTFAATNADDDNYSPLTSAVNVFFNDGSEEIWFELEVTDLVSVDKLVGEYTYTRDGYLITLTKKEASLYDFRKAL